MDGENMTPLESVKILIAEDHKSEAQLLEAFLKEAGAKVFLAENGWEACQILDCVDVDVLIQIL